jgi:phage antirepressor YoqD-like protein
MHNQHTPGNTSTDASVSVYAPNMTRQVMCSREIASLTGKQHKHVIRDIREMLVALAGDGPILDHHIETKDSRGYTAEIHLDRVLTETLLTGYSAQMRRAVIVRWHELEAKVVGQVQIPSNFAEALRLAAEQVEQNQHLKEIIQLQAPKVAAIKRLAGASGAMCITDAAKLLQIGPSQLFKWLEAHRWIYRRTGNLRWTAFQPRIDAGLMKHKVTALKADPETGLERAAFDPLVTPKGLALLAEKNIGAAL